MALNNISFTSNPWVSLCSLILHHIVVFPTILTPRLPTYMPLIFGMCVTIIGLRETSRSTIIDVACVYFYFAFHIFRGNFIWLDCWLTSCIFILLVQIHIHHLLMQWGRCRFVHVMCFLYLVPLVVIAKSKIHQRGIKK